MNFNLLQQNRTLDSMLFN